MKTNREYTAMLHEIETAQNDIRTREDRILEIMMESDELNAGVKKSEAELKSGREGDRRRARGARRGGGRRCRPKSTGPARRARRWSREIDRGVLGIFETIAKGRKGVAVAEARNGLCTICHVRLRPQVFNEVRRNDVDHPVRQLPADPLLRRRDAKRRRPSPQA